MPASWKTEELRVHGHKAELIANPASQVRKKIMFKGIRITEICIIAMLFAVSVFGCGYKKEKTTSAVDIRIEASTAFFPMTEGMIQSIFDPFEVSDLTVIPVATSEGFTDISSGDTDLLISSLPNEQQQKIMDESGKNLVSLSIAMEPLVIFVNKDNPIESLSFTQLQSLYLEEAQNWSDFGGKDLPVTTYQLTEGNGSQTAFAEYIEGMQVSENHREIETMNAIIDEVAGDCGGIGYAFASYYFNMYPNENTKVVKIDGKTYADPEYSLTCPIRIYYCKENPASSVKEIVALFQTEQGKEAVRQNVTGVTGARNE